MSRMCALTEVKRRKHLDFQSAEDRLPIKLDSQNVDEHEETSDCRTSIVSGVYTIAGPTYGAQHL